ncbi:hypothetical protein [Pedobacter insulae]|uniref:DUF2116 family Zn-ribbon domain-containing protein n=1 Tax=Pedobacter insulae TaxID=414048 RepID=A0A1I2Z7B3_9SPHI|nr:hypothetical protein [Pedobacter insulae]SFH33753.1 hypothetical protein SAMN04489864_10946 [Pedobacter insulae]
MSEATEIRYCRQCEKQLYGRLDQVYCNDYCRNTFNKQKAIRERVEPHPNQKAIFKIIQRNYEILMKLYPKPIHPNRYERTSKIWMPRDFRPEFFTGIRRIDSQIWYVCFDRGWQLVGGEYQMKDFPEKAYI